MYLRLKTIDMLHVFCLFGQNGAELGQDACVRGLKKKQLNDISVKHKRELNNSHKNVCAFELCLFCRRQAIFLIWLVPNLVGSDSLNIK